MTTVCGAKTQKITQSSFITNHYDKV